MVIVLISNYEPPEMIGVEMKCLYPGQFSSQLLSRKLVDVVVTGRSSDSRQPRLTFPSSLKKSGLMCAGE